MRSRAAHQIPPAIPSVLNPSPPPFTERTRKIASRFPAIPALSRNIPASSLAGPSVLFVYMIIGSMLFFVMRAMGELLLKGVRPMTDQYDGLRWVHFVDKLYDNAVPFAATGKAGLTELFPAAWLNGPYGKKFSRCLSRMEEMLGERWAGSRMDG